MKQLYPDLWQTIVDKGSMSLNTHAYFLQRDQGNVLFYNTSNLEDIQHIERLGGVTYQYLSHRDEAGSSLVEIKQTFNSKLCCDILEEPYVGKFCPVDITFEKVKIHSDTIEIISTPGYTLGGLSYIYSSLYVLRYLFTGDTIFQWDGKWSTLVIEKAGGSTSELIKSLLLLRDVNPNVVICSASIGDTSVVEVTSEEWKLVIDNTIKRLS